MIVYEDISFGTTCDNQCEHCQPQDDTTSYTLAGLLGQVEGLDDVENLALVGGEPTLHDDLISFVSRIREQGARRIKLVSNARRLGDIDVLSQLTEVGCRVFEVKVEGSRPEVHDAVTGVAGSFEETLTGLENLLDLGRSEENEDTLLVAVRVGVRGANLGDLVPVVSLLTSLGVDRILFERKSTDFSMPKGALIVANALKVATLNRTWSQSEGFPPCIMKGCERHVSECLDPRPRPGEKPKGCQKCDYEPFCSGPPAGYARARGSKEFRAVSNAPYIEDIQRLSATRFSLDHA
jgi:sulfatase maturation enzyme AslB (radical SAM superfamily)